MLLLTLGLALAAPPRAAALGTTALLPRTVVAPGGPVPLYLAMENRTTMNLTFEQHSSDACFLQKFADVKFEPELEPREIGPCTAPVRVVKPGESVSRLVDLSQAFDIPPNTYIIKVAWKDGGPDIYSPLVGLPGTIRFAPVALSGRVPKGEKLTLPDQSVLIFTGHRSKPSEKRGEPPLLVIDMVHRVPGTGEGPVTVELATDTQRQFNVGKYRVDLVDHQFDQWMQLNVFAP